MIDVDEDGMLSQLSLLSSVAVKCISAEGHCGLDSASTVGPHCSEPGGRSLDRSGALRFCLRLFFTQPLVASFILAAMFLLYQVIILSPWKRKPLESTESFDRRDFSGFRLGTWTFSVPCGSGCSPSCCEAGRA